MVVGYAGAGAVSDDDDNVCDASQPTDALHPLSTQSTPVITGHSSATVPD